MAIVVKTPRPYNIADDTGATRAFVASTIVLFR
jgi:hypothetical protein